MTTAEIKENSVEQLARYRNLLIVQNEAIEFEIRDLSARAKRYVDLIEELTDELASRHEQEAL